MIGTQRTGRIPGIVISAVVHSGLEVTIDGKPGQLAIVNEHGEIVAQGLAVAREAQAVAVNCYRNMLKGTGHLRVHSECLLKDAESGTGGAA